MANTICGISGVGAPCDGCAYNRKLCSPNCHYAKVFKNVIGRQDYHKIFSIFGVKNVANVLQDLSESQYMEAITSYLFEATERIENPIGGCAARVASFEQRIEELQSRVTALEAQQSGGTFSVNPCPSFASPGASEHGAPPTEVGLLAYPAPYPTILDYQAALNNFQSRSSRFYL